MDDINLSKLELQLLLATANRDKVDEYRQRAAEMFGVPYEKVTADQRRHAKETILFEAYSANGPHPLATPPEKK